LLLIAHLLNGKSSRTPSIVHMRTPRSIGPRLCGELPRNLISRTSWNSVKAKFSSAPIEAGDAKGGKRISGYYAPQQRVNSGAFLGVWGGAEGFLGKQSVRNSLRSAYTRANLLSGNNPMNDWQNEGVLVNRPNVWNGHPGEHRHGIDAVAGPQGARTRGSSRGVPQRRALRARRRKVSRVLGRGTPKDTPALCHR
jgi:hypothetical protein